METTLKYLKYLRSVARKLASPKGLDNILVSGFDITWKLPHQLNFGNRAYLIGMVSNDPSIAIYCGFGFVIGSIEVASRSKRVAGPLLYAPVSVNEDSLNVAIEEIEINRELATRLLGLDTKFAELEDENELEEDSNLTSIAHTLNKLEEEIRERSYTDFHDRTILSLTLQQLTQGPLGATLELRTEEFSVSNKEKLYKSTVPVSFTSCFTFTAKRPNAVSTYEALSKLISEVTL